MTDDINEKPIVVSDAGLMRDDGGLPFTEADIRHQASKGLLSREQHAAALGISIERLNEILGEEE